MSSCEVCDEEAEAAVARMMAVRVGRDNGDVGGGGYVIVGGVVVT